MKTRKTTIAAYLAGVTTLAVSLPAMADHKGTSFDNTSKAPMETAKILKPEG